MPMISSLCWLLALALSAFRLVHVPVDRCGTCSLPQKFGAF